MAHTVIDNNFYVDTAFLNSLGGIPGVSLDSMGFGEFYANTPMGTVEFDRMRGKDFPGRSGRSHKVYDRDSGTKATEWLIDQVESRGKSVRVASDEAVLRNRLIRLAASRPDLREHILPLVSDLSASHLPLGKAAATTLPATTDIDSLQQKLDKMTSLLIQIRTSMPPGYARIREIEAVFDALLDLEKVIRKGGL